MDLAYVILAAGIGKRLRNPYPKALTRLAGLTLLELSVKVSQATGLPSTVYVVANPLIAKDAEKILSGLTPRYRVVVNHRWWLENGFSLALAAERVEEDLMVVVMVDHVVHPTIVSLTAVNLASRGMDAVVAGDRYAYFVDHEEATKIACDPKGYVKAIGKHVKPYDYIDVGVLGFRRQSLINAFAELGDTATVSDIVQLLADKGRSAVVDVTGLPWKDVDTPTDLYDVAVGEARLVLMEVLEGIRG